jgi:hypothetical protein
MVLMALLATYFFAIPYVGFLPASAVFIIAASVWLSPRPRQAFLISLPVAGGVVGFIYVVFVHFLYAFLP